MPSIRRADAEDAAALAAFAEATFRAAFGAENAAEDMDLHCRGRFGAPLQAAEIADPTMVTLLSESSGELVGFAQLRWGEAPACVVAKRPVEIQRLYVDGAWHGKGVAQALMAALFEEMARANSDLAWLGVWERNARAIAYYRRTGFVEVGDHVFELGSDPQRDVIMVKAVVSEQGTGCDGGRSRDRVAMAGHAPAGFTFRERASGEIEVLHFGKRAAVLRAGRADRFRARVVEATELGLQHLMARMTGNYKRGNERTGRRQAFAVRRS